MLLLFLFVFFCFFLGNGNEISWVRRYVYLGTNQFGYEPVWVRISLGTNQFGYEPVWVRTSLGTTSTDFTGAILALQGEVR